MLIDSVALNLRETRGKVGCLICSQGLSFSPVSVYLSAWTAEVLSTDGKVTNVVFRQRARWIGDFSATCELKGRGLVSRRLDDDCLVQGSVVMRKLPMIENGLEQGAQKPAVALAQQHGNATQRAGTSVGVRQGQAYDARADLSA